MKTQLLLLVLLSSSLMAQAPQSGGTSGIRFEDATAKSGIQFTHSFGAQQLGSLLEDDALTGVGAKGRGDDFVSQPELDEIEIGINLRNLQPRLFLLDVVAERFE